MHGNECLDITGRSYQGNMSFTSSGILCQPWTSQCPHRHTMVSTYPELKNASNCCRNPRDSGQRPWCFTSDKNKRWEYCDIPSCLPDHTAPVETTSGQVLTKSSGAIINTILPTKFPKRTASVLTFRSKFTPTVNGSKRCIQATPIPSVKGSCVPLQYNSYCSNKGIQLDHFVFVKSDIQKENEKKLKLFQNNLDKFRLLGFSISEKCEKAINIVYCHHFYPRCDSTGDSYKAQRLCKETCQYFTNVCSPELAMLNLLPAGSSSDDVIKCTDLSSRDPGQSPECYYFDERDNEKERLNLRIARHKKECLYENGHGYQGSISVTLSGILCQSWAAQCPHRHTMVSTYPELKNASNCCRNPRGSGQRPWCFTSDKNKRWEYCDIPSCSSAVTPEKTSIMVSTKITNMSISYQKTELPTIPIINANKTMCSPAIPLPAIKPPCTRLYTRFGAYCKKHGVNLESYVFQKFEDQQYASSTFNVTQSFFETFKPIDDGKRKNCLHVGIIAFCHYYFPACDRTGPTIQERKPCKASCDYFMKTCKKEVELDEKILHTHIDCSIFPIREAGSSPECWYYDGQLNETDSSNDYTDDCLYLDGRGYKGNIAYTASGIQCQSWTAQCPHRHTMASTYPKLKNASNYCRNPGGSGKRPWCFTSDKNKRWEYCHIESDCLPVNGGYSNWTFSKKCNSTCGQGIEVWRRYCDTPAPRYGGKNCSLLGSAVQIRNCSNSRPCPRNGNYGKWMKNTTCNVTCGDGFEMWTRNCDSPSPAYGGHNCSKLGEGEKWKSCQITPCKNSPTEINNLKIAIGTGVGAVVLAILVIFIVLGYKRMKRRYEPYAILRFDKLISMKIREKAEGSAKPGVASVHPHFYANLNEDGEPISGACRGIIPYQLPYINMASLNRPYYAKLQLFSSISLDWLRNAWGLVDELGKHVYHVLSRGMDLLLPYDKLENPKDGSQRNRLGAIDENGCAEYDRFDHHPTVLIARDPEIKAEDKLCNGD